MALGHNRSEGGLKASLPLPGGAATAILAGALAEGRREEEHEGFRLAARAEERETQRAAEAVLDGQTIIMAGGQLVQWDVS